MERNRRNQCNTRNKSSLAKNGTENSANTDDYLLYKDPYEVIYNPPDIYMPCSRLGRYSKSYTLLYIYISIVMTLCFYLHIDHVCNKPTNCSINPWCVYGLGEGKDVSFSCMDAH